MSVLRPQLSRALGVALAGLALLPAAAAGSLPARPAAPQPPRSFYGVQAITALGAAPQFSDADLQRFSDGHVGTIRMHFDWSAVEPTRGTPRDWSHYDATVESVARSGTHVLGLLIGSPRFAAPRPTDPPRSKKNVGRWRSFVRDVVRRYGDGGSFWAENPDVPYDPVRSWQVWNEPNYPRFWFERPQARQYARFLRQTSPVIRQADPKASIVMGGLPNVASSSGGVRARMEDYLDELYSSSKRVRRYFDVVAIHPYAVDHKGVVAALRRVRMVMNRHGDRRAPIWITEFGWATFSRGFTATSSAGQAKRLTQSFRALARVRRRYRLRGVIWYAWRDAPAVTRDWWGLHCGLFTVDDQAKPAWRAFTRFTRRAL